MLNLDKSLRTIDRIIKKPLLKKYNDQLTETEFSTKTINNKYIISIKKLLTDKECGQIIGRAQSYGFLDIKSYSKDKRDSKRVCVLDNKLSEIIWNRLEKMNLIDSLKKMELKPYGFHTEGSWEPFKINECNRISHYSKNSKGFKCHYDSQYVHSENIKSVFTLLIYLNDNYKNGETVFYTKKDSKYMNVTCDQEMLLNGGEETYDKYVISPSKGSCILFNHDIIHMSNEIKKGNKYILRTDIVYRKNGKNIGHCSYLDKIFFNRSIDYFVEAQRQELKKNKKYASELYEKSLSIRHSVGDIGHNKNSQDIWNYIFSFLESEDINLVTLTNKLLTSYAIIYESNYWEKFGKNKLCSKEPKKKNNKKNNKKNKYNNKYFHNKLKRIIPKLIDQTGTRNTFLYDYNEFYVCNKEALLRTVGMYALYLFGHDNNHRTYIANYNPETGKILACKLEWLLGCVFYGKKLYGQYYHIYDNYAYLDENGNEIYEDTTTWPENYDCFVHKKQDSLPLTVENEYRKDNMKISYGENIKMSDYETKKIIKNSFSRYTDKEYIKNIKKLCGYSEYQNKEIINRYYLCESHDHRICEYEFTRENIIKRNNLIFNFENELELTKLEKSDIDLGNFYFLNDNQKYNIYSLDIKKLNVEQYNHASCDISLCIFEVKHKYKLLRENEINKIYIFETIENDHVKIITSYNPINSF